MKHKKQHFIPQSYLSAWTDPDTPSGQEPYVWLVNKKSLELRNRAPKNIMFERDFYTIETEEGDRDLSLEEGLSVLEGEFVRVRDRVISSRLPLNSEDRLALLAYVSAMHSRTPASSDRLSPFWEELLAKMKAMSAWAGTASPEQLQRAARVAPPDPERSHIVTVEEIQSIVDSPIPSLLAPSITAEMEALSVLDLAIVETTTSPGFVTSDNPVVWFDPEGHRRQWPHQGPALIYPTIEISMPVSTRYSLLLNRQGTNGYIKLSKSGPLAEAEVVNRANWRVQATASEFLVVSRRVLLWEWFYAPPN